MGTYTSDSDYIRIRTLEKHIRSCTIHFMQVIIQYNIPYKIGDVHRQSLDNCIKYHMIEYDYE